MNDAPGSLRLRTWLVVLLTTITSVSVLVACLVLLAIRVPQVGEETRRELLAESADMTRRAEALLDALQVQLEVAETMLVTAPTMNMQTALESVVERGAFSAIYEIGLDGVVVKVATARTRPVVGDALIGQDRSDDPLFVTVRNEARPVWSGKYRSPISGQDVVSVGVLSAVSVIVGELPLAYLFDTLRIVSGSAEREVSLLDGQGEVLAESVEAGQPDAFEAVRRSLLDGLADGVGSGTVRVRGRLYETAVARSRALDWYFIVRSPGGLANPRIAAIVDLALATAAGCTVLGLMLAPMWASSMVRPLRRIAERARRVADGDPPGSWPHGRIAEFNVVADDLARMSDALGAREQELSAIFEASPIGIVVLDSDRGYRYLRVNEAFMRLFGAIPVSLFGEGAERAGIWCTPGEPTELLSSLVRDGVVEREVPMRRLDGTIFHALLTLRNFFGAAERPRTVLIARDVTKLRRIEDEIRSLNSELEQRVERRTADLRRSNDELSSALEQLRVTQDELIRAEKLASLGALVAGVAHELNTPLGNGVMAVSTVRSALLDFRRESRHELRRSTLDALVDAVDTGTEIAARNLERAAELVTGFKQVATDQSSAQRRRFELAEVGEEIALTLRPLLRRNNVEIELAMPEGVMMDSYPGALGQVLINLVSNAVMHAFDGVVQPRLTIGAAFAEPGRVAIRVSDNGCGIVPELLPRIFDPFVTTRMGRGGTGLGLHIVHNLVATPQGGCKHAGRRNVFHARRPLRGSLSTSPDQPPRTSGNSTSVKPNCVMSRMRIG
jgi:PAS domain S-box-containing protein